MNIFPGQKHRHANFALIFGVVLGLSVGASAVFADDVEVYRTQGSDETVKPNLLFVLDESSSMDEEDGDDTTRTEELQAALRAIFADPDSGGIEGVNAALMGYSKRKYGGRRVITTGTPTGFYDADDATERASLVNFIDNIYHISGTVTVQAMASAVAWFESGFTDDDGSGDRDGCYVDRGSCPEGTGSGGDVTVITPITEDFYCAQSAIVLLTDGAPYSDQTSSNSLYDDPHPYKPGYEYRGSDCTDPDPSGFDMDRAGCTGDIAEWGYNTDLFTGSGYTGDQNIVTHTIGFHTGSNERAYLQDIANRGGGDYFESSNIAGLVAAFQTIITEAKTSIDYTFNAPVVPFNSSNTAVSGTRIYVPLLKPDVTAFWKGNLKKYGLSISDSGIALSSASGGGVVLENGRFADTAKSYWSSAIDGADPLEGGAAEHMTGTRNLYSNLDAGEVLTATENFVAENNALITTDMLGLPAPANAGDSNDPVNIRRTAILEWLTWTDAGNEHEGEIGASIHTLPEVVSYGATANDVVLLPTTEGVLHAFSAQDDTGDGGGDELWAFMPKELLEHVEELKNNEKRSVPLYGLDGPMTVYETNGRKMVVVTQRRGGRNMYALDITDRTAPTFAWSIIGGTGDLDANGDTIVGTAGFADLAQTWSKPIFTTMEIEGGSPTDVLVFGGGYDADQDAATVRNDDDSGHAIYIVNARTGSRLKTISSSAMKNGIAANILTVDINANGITDRLYAADVGGRVIRVDIPDHEFASSAISHGVIADVNFGRPSVYQRFFNTPEVAYFSRGGDQYLAVLIGSGNRPDPLDKTVQDSFYMIKDPNLWTAGTYTALSRSDLYPATANDIQDGTDDEKVAAAAGLGSKSGWYVDFVSNSGEKVFSAARVYDFAVLFTTYSGTRTGSGSACDAGATDGESKFYALSMVDASAMFADLGGDDTTLNKADRSKVVGIPGMPPPVSLLFPAGDDGGLGHDVVALVGLEEVARWADRFHAIYWEEVIEAE